MAENQSPLMAFRVAETLEPFERPGHYDAATQVWVGDTVGAQDAASVDRSTTTYYTGGAGGSDTEPDSDDVWD